MAADVRPVQQTKLPARPSSLTPEQTYWRSFRARLDIPSPTNNAVTDISQPLLNTIASGLDTFAVTTGARVQIYSQRSRKLLKTIARFNDVAHSGDLRSDGKVLVAGDDTGTIQVFDTSSRAILKTWKACKQPVWTTKWSLTDNTALMSCSDDKTVRLWDLPSEQSVAVLRGHQDYVRSGCFIPGHGGSLFASGSYDETVRIWDTRTVASPVLTFRHTAAVEAVLSMPSGSTLAAAAGNQIAILDLVGGRPLNVIQNHQKTVAALCLASQGSRLVSGGLDGHLKIFETTGWKVVAGSKYPSPVLSVSVLRDFATNEDKHIAVGMASGVLSLRTRYSGVERQNQRQREKEMEALLAGTIDDHDAKAAKKRPKGWEKRLRGTDYDGADADIVVEGNDRKKAKKPKPWEVALRRDQYKQALDIAIKGQDDLTILTLLDELRYRSALSAALQGRDEAALRPVMNWVFRRVSHPSFTLICVEISMNIMDLYSKYLEQSTQLATEVKKLHKRVQQEVGHARAAYETRGMLRLIAPDSVG